MVRQRISDVLATGQAHQIPRRCCNTESLRLLAADTCSRSLKRYDRRG